MEEGEPREEAVRLRGVPGEADVKSGVLNVIMPQLAPGVARRVRRHTERIEKSTVTDDGADGKSLEHQFQQLGGIAAGPEFGTTGLTALEEAIGLQEGQGANEDAPAAALPVSGSPRGASRMERGTAECPSLAAHGIRAQRLV